MKKEIINLTPHDIVVNGVTIPKSGQVARVGVKNTPVGQINDCFTCFVQETGEVTGLPETKDNTIFLVSLAVRNALPDRKDICSPGELIRDEKGQPVGCNGLVFNNF